MSFYYQYRNFCFLSLFSLLGLSKCLSILLVFSLEPTLVMTDFLCRKCVSISWLLLFSFLFVFHFS